MWSISPSCGIVYAWSQVYSVASKEQDIGPVQYSEREQARRILEEENSDTWRKYLEKKEFTKGKSLHSLLK